MKENPFYVPNSSFSEEITRIIKEYSKLKHKLEFTLELIDEKEIKSAESINSNEDIEIT